jgi:hypothetical protein
VPRGQLSQHCRPWRFYAKLTMSHEFEAKLCQNSASTNLKGSFQTIRKRSESGVDQRRDALRGAADKNLTVFGSQVSSERYFALASAL